MRFRKWLNDLLHGCTRLVGGTDGNYTGFGFAVSVEAWAQRSGARALVVGDQWVWVGEHWTGL